MKLVADWFVTTAHDAIVTILIELQLDYIVLHDRYILQLSILGVKYGYYMWCRCLNLGQRWPHLCVFYLFQ
jgi:hypothetical protein